MKKWLPLHHALYQYICKYDPCIVLERFAVPDRKAEPGILKNFFEVRVPLKTLPRVLNGLAGRLEHLLPNPCNWYASIAEWAVALLSVVRATDTYRIVEMGRGWGYWMANMRAIARKGDRDHVSNAREAPELDGFDDRHLCLRHGVSEPKPGKAILSLNAKTLEQAEKGPTVQVLDFMNLPELSRNRFIDLLDIDFQGAKEKFVAGNMDKVETYVGRVLTATLSRVIEGQLCEHFIRHGGIMEMERLALTPSLRGGRPTVCIVCVQMWSKPALIGTVRSGNVHEGDT